MKGPCWQGNLFWGAPIPSIQGVLCSSSRSFLPVLLWELLPVFLGCPVPWDPESCHAASHCLLRVLVCELRGLGFAAEALQKQSLVCEDSGLRLLSPSTDWNASPPHPRLGHTPGAPFAFPFSGRF